MAEQNREWLANSCVTDPKENVVVLFADQFPESNLYFNQRNIDDHECKRDEIYYSECTNHNVLVEEG